MLEVVGGFVEARPDPVTIVERAQELRYDMSRAERLLWEALRGRQLEGYKFRRQHPFEPYILDFYCVSKRLAVEVDGQGHGMGDQPARDARRDAFLREQGVKVLRLSADLVFRDRDTAIRTILGALED